eukprot:6300356-Amphidinium_carterae.1
MQDAEGYLSKVPSANRCLPRMACRLACGHAVDLLYSFLLKTLQSTGPLVEVRKYVEDMVLVAKGTHFAVNLYQAYRRVHHQSFTQANVKVNLKKIVPLWCFATQAKRLRKTAARLRFKVTTTNLGVDTQWAAWRCPVQRKRVMTFKQSMIRVRSLGLPARQVPLQRGAVWMNDVRISARNALGKGANLRRSSPLHLKLMAYGGPAGYLQVTADLNTRKLQTSTLNWPLEESVWNDALAQGRGRGPIRHLKTLANRLGWAPQPGGWHKVKWDSAKKRANKRDDRTRSAVNAALEGVWHEVRTHRAFIVGDLCVRCQEEPEDLEHILFRCSNWHKERQQVQLPQNDDIVSDSMDCFLPHGYRRYSSWFTRLELELSGLTAQADLSHSSDPNTEGMGLDTTLTLKRESGSPPGLKQSVYRAEFLADVRALEECQPGKHRAKWNCRASGTSTTGEGTPGRTRGLATAEPGEPTRRIWPILYILQKRAREPD